MSQSQKILASLLKGHRLTTFEAYVVWGITTLGQRVTDLKRLGWLIHSEKLGDDPHCTYWLLPCQGCAKGELFGAHQEGTIEHEIAAPTHSHRGLKSSVSRPGAA